MRLAGWQELGSDALVGVPAAGQLRASFSRLRPTDARAGSAMLPRAAGAQRATVPREPTR